MIILSRILFIKTTNSLLKSCAHITHTAGKCIAFPELCIFIRKKNGMVNVMTQLMYIHISSSWNKLVLKFGLTP